MQIIFNTLIVFYVILFIITAIMSYGFIYEYFSKRSRNIFLIIMKCIGCGIISPLIWGWIGFLVFRGWLSRNWHNEKD